MEVFDTYKSIWVQNEDGCYQRFQKKFYPLEKWFPSFLWKIPKIRILIYFFGRRNKKHNSFSYESDEYYKELIFNYLKIGSLDKYESLYEKIYNQLKPFIPSHKILEGLDISGEPGLFSLISKKNEFCDLDISSFSENIANEIKKLELNSFVFNFNKDSLLDKYKKSSLDIVFSRYGIGFCLDIKKLFNEIHLILKNDGIFYLSFNPSSRAVCARWMFEDYTYLKQYTFEYVKQIAENSGFKLITQFEDDKSYKWDYDYWDKKIYFFIRKYIMEKYCKELFKDCDEREYYQHHKAIIFKKIE